jgi:FKBP-type peptidyl-prolyl cis-trans isomerase
MSKKSSAPAATTAQRTSWRAVAVISLVANVALATWAASNMRSRPVAPTLAPAPAAASVAPSAGPAPQLRSAELKRYASLGSYVAENNRIADLGWTETQFAAFLDGIRASYEGRGLPLDDDAKRLRDSISERVRKMLAAEQPNPQEDYFRTLREKEGVLRTPSGLHYRVTEPGTGPNARATDTVVISFAASLPDGRKLPAFGRARTKLAVRDLLPGLAEGVQLLNVGAKALVYVPPELAFPESAWPADIPHGMPIVFFLELHDIVGAGSAP